MEENVGGWAGNATGQRKQGTWGGNKANGRIARKEESGVELLTLQGRSSLGPPQTGALYFTVLTASMGCKLVLTRNWDVTFKQRRKTFVFLVVYYPSEMQSASWEWICFKMFTWDGSCRSSFLSHPQFIDCGWRSPNSDFHHQQSGRTATRMTICRSHFFSELQFNQKPAASLK